MAKTNFSKVESAFDAGLRKLNIEQLLKFTESGYDKPAVVRERTCILMIYDADRLYKKEPNFFTKLGLSYLELKKKLEQPLKMSDEQWKEVVEIKEKIDTLAKAIDEAKPDANNEDLVEKERVKHINKRYNVKDRWLPLK